MPSKRRFTVPAEVEAEPIAAPEPIAASVDHSSNGLTVSTVTDIPSQEWGGQRIPELERQLAEAKDLAEKLRKPLARAKFQREVLHQPVPELEAMKEAQRLAEESVIDLTSHLDLARAEMVAAKMREDAAELQRQTDRARSLAHEVLKADVMLDHLFAQIEPVCGQIDKINRQLSGLSGATGISQHRLNYSGKFVAAIFASAPTLAKILELPRAKTFSAYEKLAVADARSWSRFCGGIHVPTIDEAKSDLPLAIDPGITGEHGALAKDTISTNGTTYEPGDLIAPEIVLSWPMKNRAALVSTGKLEYLAAPKPQQDGASDA